MKTIKKLAVIATALLGAATTNLAFAIENVSIGLVNPPAVSNAAFMAFGEKLGFFEAENLKLEFVQFAGGGTVVPQVANKSVNYGYAGIEVGIIAASKREPFPVTFVYSYFPASVNEMVVLESSNIRELAELSGKRVGVLSLSASHILQARASFRAIGRDWDKEVQMVPVGSGPAAWKQLENGSIAALTSWNTLTQTMRQSGMKVRSIPYSDFAKRAFGMALMAHNDTIKNNPGQIERLGRAFVKSMVACNANPDGCIRSYWAAVPASKPRPEREAVELESAKALIALNLAAMLDFPKGVEPKYGKFSGNDGLATYARALLGEDFKYDWHSMYTNRFVDAYYNFDKARVIEKAKVN
jgi:NitT/TauT family transport system substrate-binding protein